MGGPQKTNSTQQDTHTTKTQCDCEECGKNHNKGGPYETDDEHDEPINEHTNEPVSMITPNISIIETNKKWVSKSKYKRELKQRNKLKLSAVYNYSSIKLTENMEELLNLGLNFAVLPLKLDITQILVDFKKFERTMVWHEFWYNKDEEEKQYIPPIFKTNKSNFQKS